MLIGGNRLARVIRLRDLPAPLLSLKVQDGSQQCGIEIVELGTRPRPTCL
jgi:hypothetical protein